VTQSLKIFFRKALWKWGVRYRKNVKLFGKPDIAIKKYKLVIFIDGDYWHGNNWRIRGFPSLDAELETYSGYWRNKIRGNIERDKKVNEYYISLGWTVLRFWQSDIEKDLTACIGLVRQPGWLSPKSCKMLRILRFYAEVVRKLEVSEQL
jgi:DNA mismatch endonuclease (patch repair protein)